MNIERLRDDFPVLRQTVHGRPLVYLDNAATTHKPQSVIDRLVSFYSERNSSAHRSAHTLAQAAGTDYENARVCVQEFLNAPSSSEIVFTSGATDSINLVASAFRDDIIRPNDEVVISAMEHHSNLVPWQLACSRAAASIRVIPLDETGGLQVDTMERLMNPHTRLVAVTHVSNVTGIVNPLPEIISIAHSHDVPVLIDGSQAAPHMGIDVTALDCDFYVFSGHKIYSETGIGVLYGKHRWLEALPPFRSGGGMLTTVTLEKSKLEAPPLRFEAGTQNVAGALGLEAALAYLSNVGLKRIGKHEEELLRRLESGLRTMDGVMVYGDVDSRCGSLSFNISGAHHTDVGMVLDRLGIAVRTGAHCAQPYVRAIAGEGTIRASVGLYNTAREIDDLLAAVEMARALLC